MPKSASFRNGIFMPFGLGTFDPLRVQIGTNMPFAENVGSKVGTNVPFAANGDTKVSTNVLFAKDARLGETVSASRFCIKRRMTK